LRKALAFIPALLLWCALVSLVPASCFAQDQANSAPLETRALTSEPNAFGLAAFPAVPPSSAPASPAPTGPERTRRIGVGVTIGSLGIGGEAAVRVLKRANVRFGFSGIGFGYNFNRDQITYGARLRLEGAQATFDFFPFGGFHISPGALLYNGTQITGTASVASGTTFTLNSVSYESSAASPVTGSVGVTFRKVAPVILFGFGNLIPRGSRHWSITSDFGIAYSGSPKAALNLTGLVCAPGTVSGPTCQNIGTTGSIQSNVTAEQSNLNSKLSFFKIYPVASVAFGYSF